MILHFLVALFTIVHSKSGTAGGGRAGTTNSYGYTYTPYAAVAGGMYLSGRWSSRRSNERYKTPEGDAALAQVVGNVTFYKQLCECPPDTKLRWYNGWDVGVGRKDGLGGCGLTACQDRYGESANTVFTCYDACLAHPRCKAFEYAPKNGDKNHPGMSVCSLHNSTVPNELVESANNTHTSVFCEIDRSSTTTPSPIDASSSTTWDLFMNGNVTTIVANMLGSVGDPQKQDRLCGADPPGDALDIERLYAFDSNTCASRNCKAIISEPQCKEAAAAITDAVYMEATTLALPDFMNATQPTSCEQDNGCAYLSQSNQVRQCNNYVDKCTKASPCLCWCTIASSTFTLLTTTNAWLLVFVFLYHWF